MFLLRFRLSALALLVFLFAGCGTNTSDNGSVSELNGNPVSGQEEIESGVENPDAEQEAAAETEDEVQYVAEDWFVDPVTMLVLVRRGRDAVALRPVGQEVEIDTSEIDELLLSDEVLLAVVNKYAAAFPTDDLDAVARELKHKIQVTQDENEPFLYKVETSIAPSLFGAALLEQWHEELENALNKEASESVRDEEALRNRIYELEDQYGAVREEMQQHVSESETLLTQQGAGRIEQSLRQLSELEAGYSAASQRFGGVAAENKFELIEYVQLVSGIEEATTEELARIDELLEGEVVDDPGIDPSLAREQLFELEVELAECKASLGAGHPQIRALEAQIAFFKGILEDAEDAPDDAEAETPEPGEAGVESVRAFFAQRDEWIESQRQELADEMSEIEAFDRKYRELESQLGTLESQIITLKRQQAEDELLPATPLDRVVLLTVPKATATAEQVREYGNLRLDCPALPEFTRDRR
ncbi:MAG: hypothetical protein AAF456_11700 [Planctomycetota bacterium]